VPVIDPSELISRTFLMDKEDGQWHRARILNVIDEEEICKRIGKHERELFQQPGHVQFVCSVNLTILGWIPVMVDMEPLIIWLV
jgi:hypothetical protein